MLGTAPHLQGKLQGQHAAPCFQQSCVLCTGTAKPYAGSWLSSRFQPQPKKVVLELAAKADLAAVALRPAQRGGLCQVAARLWGEMALHEPKFHFCMELSWQTGVVTGCSDHPPNQSNLLHISHVVPASAHSCGCVQAGCALCPC